MDAETYRVDLAFEVTAKPDPDRLAQVTARLAALLPPGAQTLRVDAPAGNSDGLARIAARVHAHGPAQALRDVARTVEIIAAEAGHLDNLGPMRRTVVEYLGD
jgi:hypothetical protein